MWTSERVEDVGKPVELTRVDRIAHVRRVAGVLCDMRTGRARRRDVGDREAV